jgi:hypothetical protein
MARAYLIVDPDLRPEHRRQLDTAGIDVPAAEQRDQLELRHGLQVYLAPVRRQYCRQSGTDLSTHSRASGCGCIQTRLIRGSPVETTRQVFGGLLARRML